MSIVSLLSHCSCPNHRVDYYLAPRYDHHHLSYLILNIDINKKKKKKKKKRASKSNGKKQKDKQREQ